MMVTVEYEISINAGKFPTTVVVAANSAKEAVELALRLNTAAQDARIIIEYGITRTYHVAWRDEGIIKYETYETAPNWVSAYLEMERMHDGDCGIRNST